MSGWMLHASATVQCTHATGTGVLRRGIAAAPAHEVLLSGLHALTIDDVGDVMGCAFMNGSKPQPCTTVDYLGKGVPSSRVTILGRPAILSSTAGMGKSADQIPGGPVMTPAVKCQTRVVAE